MKPLLLLISACALFLLGFSAIHQTKARAGLAETVVQSQSLSVAAPVTAAELMGTKKCSFNSDCKGYGKCSAGQCGGCGFNSDCGGYGKCVKGQCGGCSFDSDCKGFGKCSSGQCTKSPW